MEEIEGMRIGATGLPGAISQAVLLQGLLQCLQFSLGHISLNLAILEVFDESGLEALVCRAIVLALANGQIPVVVTLFDVLGNISLELVIILGHHGKA